MLVNPKQGVQNFQKGQQLRNSVGHLEVLKINQSVMKNTSAKESTVLHEINNVIQGDSETIQDLSSSVLKNVKPNSNTVQI